MYKNLSLLYLHLSSYTYPSLLYKKFSSLTFFIIVPYSSLVYKITSSLFRTTLHECTNTPTTVTNSSVCVSCHCTRIPHHCTPTLCLILHPPSYMCLCTYVCINRPIFQQVRYNLVALSCGYKTMNKSFLDLWVSDINSVLHLLLDTLHLVITWK